MNTPMARRRIQPTRPMPPSRPTTSGLLEHLNQNSTPYRDPLDRINWKALDRKAFWLPESALSLYGLPEYARLSGEQRRALSHYEFLNFIIAGLWLEGIFMERISRSLRRPSDSIADRIYRLHELREEAGHSLMFLEVMRRSGLPLPPMHSRSLSIATLLGRYAPFESAGFQIAVLLGEEVPDRLNRYVQRHRAEICPAISDMVKNHLIDEARHIAHARDVLNARRKTLRSWRTRLLRPLLNAALRDFVRAFYFPGPRVYELAGLTPGKPWADAARRNPHRLAFVDDTVRPTLRMLQQYGIELDWR